MKSRYYLLRLRELSDGRFQTTMEASNDCGAASYNTTINKEPTNGFLRKCSKKLIVNASSRVLKDELKNMLL